MENSNPSVRKQANASCAAKVLLPTQVEMIEQALQQIGDYGEVRLVVEKGKLRYIEVAKSMDMLKLQDLS
jgi:hypothetical protein